MKGKPWRMIISIGVTIAILILAYVERSRILSALSLVWGANPYWLLAAVGVSLCSFFCTSLVYFIGLRSLGYRHFNQLWVYAITVVALILSQSIPAGGVASYAFLARALHRRNVPPGHAALLATLEAITYVTSMLLLFGYAIVYLSLRSGVGAAEETSLAAGVIGVIIVATVIFVITRDRQALLGWLLPIKNWLARLFRRDWHDDPIERIVNDLVNGRSLIMARPWMLFGMVGVQLVALAGHSLVMKLVFISLGTNVAFRTVAAGFGVVLVTGTFNALPGGGGTVETALALTLSGLGVGDVAIPAAIVFRLINFWIMTPVALIFYRWVMHTHLKPLVQTTLSYEQQPSD